MFQRIVVPLDGSTRAEQALPIAARIARASHGSVLLLSVLVPPMSLSWSMQLPPSFPANQEAEHQATTAYLARLADSETLKGVETTTEVLKGQPARVILDTTEARSADLIVLCSHGRTGIKRWVLGSVAQKVARHSLVPVLILREGIGELASEHPRIRSVRVMIALDSSPLAERALQPAVQLSKALSAPLPGALHLVRVLPFTTTFDYGQEDAVAQARRQATQDAQTYLHTIQEQLQEKNQNLSLRASLASSLDTAETLINIAETGEGEGMSTITSTSDLIALATHGRSGPARWALGSVTERILSATSLPLLIVRSQPQSQAGESHGQQEDGAKTT